jgi:hypothetical protein
MARAIWKWTHGLAATAAFALPAAAQVPSAVETAVHPDILQAQGPVTPTPRPPQTPGTVPATPPPGITAPVTPGGRPRTPVSTQSGMALGLTAAGTTARPVELPNMYGDMGGLFNYTPYTQGITPAGQRVTLLPGQTQRFPAGTVFNRDISAFSVLRTGTVIQLPDIPLPPGFREKLGERETLTATTLTSGQRSATDILVTGDVPKAHTGALPVNTVRGAFKIAENESPRPVDRVYLTYNFFHDVNSSLAVPGLPITNVHRQTLGFEKTFLGGDASIGFRLPLLQLTGPSDLDRATVGDLSIVLKYALINNPFEPTPDGTLSGGEVLSTGLVITTPTGGAAAFTAQDPQVHPTVIQPWVGGIVTFPRAYAQFFSSLAVPTDGRDTVFYFNSLQVGYLLYRDPTGSRYLSSVTPLAEVHVNTPLNNRGILRLPIAAVDQVSFTGGTTFGLGRRSFLNLGANVPVTGPRPYTVEAMAHLNILY